MKAADKNDKELKKQTERDRAASKKCSWCSNPVFNSKNSHKRSNKK